MSTTVIVYQSGQRVERTGWYEAVGVTRSLAPNETLTLAKLEIGTSFPDWKGRAICWRLYTLEEMPQDKTANSKTGA